MKTSNLILSLVTLPCAVGSAVASKTLAPSPTWISGQTTAPGNPITCSTLGNLCDPAESSSVCLIIVQIFGGSAVSTRGFSNSVCIVPRASGIVYTGIIKPNLVTVVPY